MKVELLYFDGCSNWRRTLEDLKSVLEEYRVESEVGLTKVACKKEAQQMAFLGSPTVRVNEVDIELDIPDSGYSLDCRVYLVDDEALKRPPKEWIAAAIEAALE